MSSDFESQDFSATAPTLRRYFSDPILNLIPKTVSPNALTLFGGCAAGGTALILWFAQLLPQAQSFNGRIILIMGALFLIIYAICDQLDGLQARRTARGGPSGDFLDHWVDALLANLIPIGLMNFMIYDFYFTLVMTIVVSLTFWANNWETKTQNSRKLPFLGGLEFIWVGVVCLGATAIWGNEFWDMKVAFVEMRHIAYALVITTLSFSMLRNIWRNWHVASEILTPLFSFSAIAMLLISLHEWHNLSWFNHYFGLLAIGLMGVKHTGDQMRQLWLNQTPKTVEFVFVLPSTAIFLILLLADPNSYLSGLISPLLFVFVLLCVWQLCFQSVNTFTLLSERFKPAASMKDQPPLKRIMVDMSATLLHHGHIRLLKQAKELGHVVVGLTSDADLIASKKLESELTFDQRTEILLGLKYVDEVVETPWLLTEEVLQKHNIDLLVHGDDNQNQIPPEKLVIFPRTEGISSDNIRLKAAQNLSTKKS